MGLDPRPMSSSPALTSDKAPIYNAKGVNNTFFHEADYIGAFGDKNWLAGWTFLSFAGIASNMGAGIPMMKTANGITDPTVGVEAINIEGIAGLGCYPNPMKTSTEVQFSLEKSSKVKIDVYNLLGVKLESLVNQEMSAGSYGVKWEAKEVPAGMYFIRMELPNKIITEKVVIE